MERGGGDAQRAETKTGRGNVLKRFEDEKEVVSKRIVVMRVGIVVKDKEEW